MTERLTVSTVQLLRELSNWSSDHEDAAIIASAADEIEALRAALTEIRALPETISGPGLSEYMNNQAVSIAVRALNPINKEALDEVIDEALSRREK